MPPATRCWSSKARYWSRPGRATPGKVETAVHSSGSYSVALEADQGAHRNVERLQPSAAAEIRQVDDEAGGKNLRPHLPQQLDRGFGRAAGGDQIVDQDHLLAGRDRIAGHLHLVEPVFQAIGDPHRVMRQLAFLADRDEAGGQLMGDRAAENEAARLDAG